MTLQPSIFKMFAPSPIKPIQEHMAKVSSCAQTLVPFIDAVLANDWQAAHVLQRQISDLEHEADVLKKDLRLHLPKGLFMPVSRGDILELLKAQDSVANQAEDIAGLMLGRRMKIPGVLEQPFRAFVVHSVDASEQANKVISELDELFETGFKGFEIDLIVDMIHKLDDIEHETDEMQIDIRRRLFELEQQLPPIEVMFLYKIIEWVGELADKAQQVGSKLQLFLAH